MAVLTVFIAVFSGCQGKEIGGLVLTELPGVPTVLKADDLTTTSFKLIWYKTPGADKYRVYKDGKLYKAFVFDNLLNITGLTKEVNYVMQVSSENQRGESSLSSPFIVRTPGANPPGAPTGLAALNITTASFMLNWNPVDKALYYKIYKNNSLLADNVAGTSKEVNGLTADTTYVMAVSAVNSNGESQKAEINVKTLPEQHFPPEPPTGLAATEVTSSGFKLAWNKSTGATKYSVYLDNVLTMSDLVFANASLTGLTANTSYNVQVTASNTYGESAKSSPITVLTRLAPPAGLAASMLTDSSFTLSWNAVASATGYNIYRDGVLVVQNLNALSKSISGLQPDTSYRMEVCGLTASSEGDKAVLTVRTLLPPPTGLASSNITGNSFTLDWNSVTGATGYKVYVNGVLYSTVGNSNEVVITGLNPNTQYQITVTAVNGVGTEGVPSQVLLVTTLNNSPPVATSVSNQGNSGEITISYNLADNENNACSIKFYFSKNGGTTYVLSNNLNGATTGIVPGTGKTIGWKSNLDIATNEINVKVKILPNDGVQDGTAGESGVFQVLNGGPLNNPPVSSNVNVVGNSGSIQVTFDLADAENDKCSIVFKYSKDGGTTYTQSGSVFGPTTNLTPGPNHAFTWNSTADVTTNEPNVKIMVLPNDGKVDGVPGYSAVFAVNNGNTPPAVNTVTTSGNSDSIEVTYNLTDADNDPCKITFYYSKNGGTNYIQSNNVSGTTTGIAPGTGKKITWGSFQDIKTNEPNVRVRILPNDGKADGTPGESIVFAVNNFKLVGLTLTPNSTEVQINSKYALSNITVTAVYSDGSTKVVTTGTWKLVNGNGAIIAGNYEAPSSAGTAVLRNTYVESGVTVTADFNVTIVTVAKERIVFCSSRDGGTSNLEIYIMNDDGTNVTRLTNNTQNDLMPCVSRAGTSIIFSRDLGTYNYELFKMNIDGTNQQNMTNNPGAADGMGAYSFDGSKIAYVSAVITMPVNPEIFTMNADGTGSTKLTNIAGNDTTPRFSPSGTMIVFSSDRDGSNEIFTMTSSGGNQTQLTYTNKVDNVTPMYSTDESKILYCTNGNGSGKYQIYTMNTDGTNANCLTNSPYNEQSPCYSIDGKKVVFSSDRNGNTDIYTMNASDGTNQLRITTDPGEDTTPWYVKAP